MNFFQSKAFIQDPPGLVDPLGLDWGFINFFKSKAFIQDPPGLVDPLGSSPQRGSEKKRALRFATLRFASLRFDQVPWTSRSTEWCRNEWL
jgi:hypothetical protein